MSSFIRRVREDRRTRRLAGEREATEMLQLSLGVIELMVDLRKMADYDKALPQALADHMRKDLWNDPQWLFEAAAMTPPSQKLRILGHRLRIGAGWDADEVAIDSTQADSVRVLHAGQRLWIAAEGLYTIRDRFWWGHLRAGGFQSEGTYGPPGAGCQGPMPIDEAGLARSIPELLARLGGTQT